MTVYVDVLIATNLFINWLLLLGTKRILHCEAKNFRLAAASFVGSLYSLIIFWENMPTMLKIPLNFAVLSLITLIAFKPKSIKRFLKNAAAFLLVNYIFAGLMLALWFFVSPDRMLYNNFVVYFDIDVKLLIVLSALCYAILRLITAFVRHISPQKKTVSVTLTNKGRSVTANALVDTGNSLCDGFTGSYAVVADKSVITALTGESLYSALERQTEGVHTDFQRIRLVPVNTVSSGSLLAAVRIESLTVSSKRRFDNVLLAQSRSSLPDEYSVIINDSFLSEE